MILNQMVLRPHRVYSIFIQKPPKPHRVTKAQLKGLHVHYCFNGSPGPGDVKWNRWDVGPRALPMVGICFIAEPHS